MDYDVARAKILLRDLEGIGRGHAPGVELATSTDGGPVVRGTGTRLGLLRTGVRLARAALEAESVVVIYPDGEVGADGSTTDGLVQVHLADDAPAVKKRPSRWWWVLMSLMMILNIIVLGLFLVGLVTAIRWVVTSLGSG